MTEELHILSNDLGLSTVLYEALTSTSTMLNMVDHLGNPIVFGDGGNWIDNTGSQMIDNALADLIFGGGQWGAVFTEYYNLGQRVVQDSDLSLNILRS